MKRTKLDNKQLKIKKTPYELGKELFGKYSSEDTDLSITYKQKLKNKIIQKIS